MDRMMYSPLILFLEVIILTEIFQKDNQNAKFQAK